MAPFTSTTSDVALSSKGFMQTTNVDTEMGSSTLWTEPSAPLPKGAENPKQQSVQNDEEAAVPEAAIVEVRNDAMDAIPVPVKPAPAKGAWQQFKASGMATMNTIRLHPLILILPLMAFGLMVGLGVWGVMAASSDSASAKRNDARALAVDVATGFELQLKETFTPAVTLQLMVELNPSWPFWVKNWEKVSQELMSRVVPGSIYNIQAQPLGQVRIIHPLRPSDRSQYGKDLLLDAQRRPVSLDLISRRVAGISVTYLTPQNFTAAFVRQPVFINSTGPLDDFGYSFPGAKYTKPEFPEDVTYAPVPASGPATTGWPSGYQNNCTLCYVPANATAPSDRWWGFVTLTINFQAVVEGKDSRMLALSDKGYKYTLMRPLNATANTPIVQVGGGVDFGSAESVTVNVPGQKWTLWVEPEDGWEPSWEGPLIAAVVIIAAVISSLLFVALLYHNRQGSLLNDTIRANEELARTTAALEEEKTRMDALLVRQYGLLACLDFKHLANAPSVMASTGLTMERIEEARRLVNEASNNESLDQIQINEILGEGAFGKVHKGLWRGTVVAIKTMILPANMAGAEKREKMAVMEAAISSSLVHPNIVTTYTYSIRPHVDGGNGDMLEGLGDFLKATPMGTTVMSGPNDGASRADSVQSSSAVHSYEVRLVLEFCDKGSLYEALEQGAFMKNGGLQIAAIVETAADIAKAMVHMHAASILHSDLKARNIMLKSSGLEGRGVIAKVADFGLSTQMTHTETHVSSMFQGTLTHMAPEVMLEGRISKAGDVYSYGIMMWEIFTGSKPFADVPRAHLGHAITKENRRPKFPLFAPQEYVKLAESCWAPDAADRPTFTTILASLQALLSTMPATEEALIIVPPKPLGDPSKFRSIQIQSHASSSAPEQSDTGSAIRMGGGGTSFGRSVIVREPTLDTVAEEHSHAS